MSQAVADSVRHLPTVVVSDAFCLRPDAVALASQDVAWWQHNPDAMLFAGRKFSGNRLPGVEQLRCSLVPTGTNSGLFGMEVARHLGATELHLYGFDMQGSHYFGPHPEGLRNTSPERFEVFQKQFARWKKVHHRTIVKNRTFGSALRAYPYDTG